MPRTSQKSLRTAETKPLKGYSVHPVALQMVAAGAPRTADETEGYFFNAPLTIRRKVAPYLSPTLPPPLHGGGVKFLPGRSLLLINRIRNPLSLRCLWRGGLGWAAS